MQKKHQTVTYRLVILHNQIKYGVIYVFQLLEVQWNHSVHFFYPLAVYLEVYYQNLNTFALGESIIVWTLEILG